MARYDISSFIHCPFLKEEVGNARILMLSLLSAIH
jgi:hypothetical protein